MFEPRRAAPVLRDPVGRSFDRLHLPWPLPFVREDKFRAHRQRLPLWSGFLSVCGVTIRLSVVAFELKLMGGMRSQETNLMDPASSPERPSPLLQYLQSWTCYECRMDGANAIE